MPGYVIDAGASMTLPAQELHIRCDAGPEIARLDVVRVDRSPLRVVRLDRTRVILPEVTGMIAVVAEPTSGKATFGADTQLSVDIAVGGADAGADQVRVDIAARPVGGRYRTEVARLVPHDGRVELSVPADVRLSPLAEAACNAAHRQLGAQPRRELAARVHLVADPTSSMAGRVRDGSVAALLEALTGVTIAAGMQVHSVSVLGPRTAAVAPSPPESLGDRVLEAMRSVGAGVGFADHRVPPGETAEVALVITDSVRTGPYSSGADRRYLALRPPSPAEAGTDAIDPARLAELDESAESAPAVDALVAHLLAAVTVDIPEDDR